MYPRKERNKMHARQTRNRKKMFTSKMQETIQLLERKNLLMHFQLQGLLQSLSGVPMESNVRMYVCMYALVPTVVPGRLVHFILFAVVWIRMMYMYD